MCGGSSAVTPRVSTSRGSDCPRLCGGGGAVTLARMRLTEFWERMRAQFGEVYAESVAKDYVLSGLGNRTVDQALAEGTDAKTVWRAVCEAFKVPDRQR
jgi:hypothetical protein